MQSNISSRCVFLDLDNIDTDQIIPSDYLKTTVKSNLILGLFDELKSELAETIVKDIFNKEISILISGENFGCGSSREHAVWALQEAGFKIIIAESFADIFKSNALKNGILPIELSKAEIKSIIDLNSENLNVDMENQVIQTDKEEYAFELSTFQKYLFMNNLSEFDYLKSKRSQILDYERNLNV